MDQRFSWELFQRLPVVGILRGFERRTLPQLVEASIAGGLTNLEITMNTPDAVEQIRDAVRLAGGKMNVGAGTVVGLDALEAARGAGATFVVTPVVEPGVIERCRDLDLPVFPGAFTPTEVVRAWELGASMVKLFPAEAVGPGYIQRLKELLPQIQLMPTGGVDVETLGAYLRAGADAFGVGNPLFNKERVAACDWRWIENQCRTLGRRYAEGG